MTSDNRPKETLPRARYEWFEEINIWEEPGREEKGARFPWIHNKGAVDLDFHSVDIFSSKNHVAVASC